MEFFCVRSVTLRTEVVILIVILLFYQTPCQLFYKMDGEHEFIYYSVFSLSLSSDIGKLELSSVLGSDFRFVYFRLAGFAGEADLKLRF
jgi:hypothetical protein